MGADPKESLADTLKKDFGSVERWKAECTAVGRALAAKPIACCWLVLGANGCRHLGGRPPCCTWRSALALDVYELAYAMDYGARAAGYVDAFMQVIKWDNAQSLISRYSKET